MELKPRENEFKYNGKGVTLKITDAVPGSPGALALGGMA
jgi:hypothetical protein